MRSIVIACLVLVLSGCTTYLPIKFPAAPKPALEPCSELQTIPEGETRLSAVLSVVVSNYAEYHKCKIKQDAWIEWYYKNQEIYNEHK